MKIAVITGRGFETFGGIEVFVKEVYGRLARNGHQIIVYSRGNGLHLDCPADIRIHNVPCLRLPHLDILSHCIFSVLDTWLRKIDIICYHGAPAALASCIPVGPGVKKVVIFHGLDWKSSIFNNFLKLAIRISEIIGSKCSDKLIVVSEYLREYFMTKHDIHPIHIAPGVEQYDSQPAKKILKFGLGQNNYILYLGRLAPEKGCHLLIYAHSLLNIKMKLVIAGPNLFSFRDIYSSRLKKIAQNDKRIIFVGAVNGELKNELLSNAYIVAYPSLVGGLPLAVLEAIGYGRCTLISSVCEYYDILKSCAVFFKTGDVQDLAEKLQGLIEDPLKCSDYGRSAQKYITSKFSWKNTALKFEDVFQDINNND